MYNNEYRLLSDTEEEISATRHERDRVEALAPTVDRKDRKQNQKLRKGMAMLSISLVSFTAGNVIYGKQIFESTSKFLSGGMLNQETIDEDYAKFDPIEKMKFWED